VADAENNLSPLVDKRGLARQQLLDIIEFLPDATFVIDINRRVIAWNRAIEEMTGVLKADILGQGDYAYAIPLYGKRTPMLIDLVTEPEPGPEARYTYIRREGQRLLAETYVPSLNHGAGAYIWGIASPLLDPAGNRYGTIESIRDITPRRQAENALRDSEAEYRMLFDTAAIGIFRTTLGGKLVAGNLALARSFGYESPEEMIGSVNDIGTELYAGDPPRSDIMRELVEHGRTHMEREFHTRDGRSLWGAVDMRLLRDAHGEPSHVNGFFDDVTERVLAAKDRRRAEQQLLDIIEFLPDATFVIDLNKRVIAWNRAIEEMTGVLKADIIGQGDYAYAIPFYGERRPIVVDLIGAEDAATESSYTWLTRYGNRIVAEVYLPSLRGGGEGAWIWVTASPLLDQAGNRYGAIESVRDVTVRKRAEQELRDSEERYRALFQNNPSMYFTLGADGEVIAVNEYGASELGYTIQELEGRSVFDVIYQPDHEAARGHLNACLLAPSQVHSWQFRKIRRDGTILWVEETARAVAGPGATMNVLVVCHDITRRKQAEEERARLQEQLQQAQKLESVGRLAGGVAHDFNNLLTVINGYADLVMNKLKDGDPLGDQVNEIRKAGARAADLTQQLLAFSRKQIIRPQLLDLNAVVTDSRRMFERLVGEDIEVVTVLSPSLGLVLADSGQLHQVLMNLIVNSHDAMPRGGQLIIETANAEPDRNDMPMNGGEIVGPCVLLSVTDTGTGMDRETLEHLFEPFFTTKGKGQGTGLGLSTVYGIVRQNGGTIHVETSAGKGTTFRIYLPRASASAVPEPTAETVPKRLRGGETILVVEDQEAVRNLTLEMLRSHGYRTLGAANGGEALLLAERYPEPIHLMLTDVVMPGMNGKELANRLKPLRPQMAVLYMSGYEDDTVATRGLLEPGTACVLKPFTRDALAAKVREALLS
jgi:PAS domain S-box-containing protein